MINTMKRINKIIINMIYFFDNIRLKILKLRVYSNRLILSNNLNNHN